MGALWWTRSMILLPVVISWTSRLPPWVPLSTVSTAPCTGATPITPIIGRTGSFSLLVPVDEAVLDLDDPGLDAELLAADPVRENADARPERA